jgi:hypothetical protein
VYALFQSPCVSSAHLIHSPRFKNSNDDDDDNNNNSRDSSVGIALDYELDDRGSMVRFPAGAGNFSLSHRVQTGSGAHTASYQMGTRVSFPGGKSAGA